MLSGQAIIVAPDLKVLTSKRDLMNLDLSLDQSACLYLDHQTDVFLDRT